MFTGLIKDIGRVINFTPNLEGAKIIIQTKLASEINVDDSVAVNGCCLTATKVGSDYFEVQAVHVTLAKTSIGTLRPNSVCNLELALKANDRLGGHFVQGHVNGIGKLKSIKKIGNNYEMAFHVQHDQMRYLVKEGSISLDGVSLTIADLEHDQVTVSLIPHTLSFTTLGSKKIGDTVNVEVDILAKYIEKLIGPNLSLLQAKKDDLYQGILT
jgi:riboflavin synthase